MELKLEMKWKSIFTTVHAFARKLIKHEKPANR